MITTGRLVCTPFSVVFILSLNPPSYSVPLLDIHKELFTQFINWTGSLNFLLCAANNEKARATFASWVPDWGISPEESWLNVEYLFGHSKSHATSGSFEIPFGWKKWSFRGDNEFVVRALWISRISWCCNPFTETASSYEGEEHAVHLHNLQNIRKVFDQYCDIRPPIETLLWASRFMPMGNRSLHRISSFHKPSQIRFFANVEKDKKNIDRDFEDWHKLLDSTGTLPIEDIFSKIREDNYVMAEHIKLCNDLAPKKRVIFTRGRNKTKLGNGPKGARIGDEIVLIWGVSMPLIVRRYGARYRLIGFADIEGMMDSEY